MRSDAREGEKSDIVAITAECRVRYILLGITTAVKRARTDLPLRP